MTERKIRGIIFFASLALVGLISTQLFWIIKAVDTGKRQFQHQVHYVLKNVVRELEYHQDTLKSCAMHNYDSMICCEPAILQVIDTVLLDSLIKKYINYQNLPDRYFYKIVHSKDDLVVYSSDLVSCNNYEDCKSEPFKTCLSGVWRQDSYHIQLFFPTQNRHILLDLATWLMLSVIFLIVIVLCFVYIIKTVIRQKKLSEIKNDFINNMTHEFKTPISTISLASEILVKSEQEVSEKVKKYAQIIFDENQRMRTQVEKVLNMALIDRGDFVLNKEIFDIHELIASTVDKLCIDQCSENSSVTYDFQASHSIVHGDPLHITNIINNLVDNAIKYSDKKPEIVISTINKNNQISISFIDNGIGMSHDTMNRVFEKFYRVPTGNIHNVKGFGLGLNYVKTMIEAHNGTITVRSELKKGSTFELLIPVYLEG
jgi:two-component system, OmpR family, phosphate regulon sensor histidine kinase PhoR